MNPGIVVKLRPAGPWRIGPDSGARNRVDVIYHSDSLYSAVTSAMARMGTLEEWLDATARSGAPAVSFGSCFPFLDEIGFVVPPRTVWPPSTPALMSARVRWKSARFVPLGIVQAILAGQTLDEDHWSLDGPSECLVPAGRPGPFRTSVRWSAAVDRLSGATERHSTACIEFRPGAGLWTVASFADESARARWSGPVKAAFRLLADSGFGGERSRGWGRAEAPEFVEGTLPEMILGKREGGQGPGAGGLGEDAGASTLEKPAPPATETERVSDDSDAPVRAARRAGEAVIPLREAASAGGESATNSEAGEAGIPPAAAGEAAANIEVGETAVPPTADVQATAGGDDDAANNEAVEGAVPLAAEVPGRATAGEVVIPPTVDVQGPATDGETTTKTDAGEPPAADVQPLTSGGEAVVPPPDVEAQAPDVQSPAPGGVAAPDIKAGEAVLPLAPGPRSPAPGGVAAPDIKAGEAVPPLAPGPRPPAPVGVAAHWFLSLYVPAPADSVDWRRGNYSLLARGGRIESAAGSGELKKQVQMVTEGSVLYADAAPLGSAPDVAPDGFAHPVFRAGFAVSIPLPEVG